MVVRRVIRGRGKKVIKKIITKVIVAMSFHIPLAIHFIRYVVFVFSEDLLDKIWGWEGLVPLHSDIKWYDDCSSHLEYYKCNAYDFIAPACQNQQIASSAICKSVSNPLA